MRQQKAVELCKFSSQILLYGGSRSGKTTLIVAVIILRALKFPNTKHLMVRLHATSSRRTLFETTVPFVLKNIADNLWSMCKIHQQEMRIEFPNGSEIFIDGVEDKDRLDKMLGSEYASIFLDECSQISYKAYTFALTRLSGGPKNMKKLLFLAENPPLIFHWTYQLFFQNINPVTKNNIDAKGMVAIQINPSDNVKNIGEDYIKSLEENLEGNAKERFLYGRFTDIVEGGVYSAELSRARKEGRISYGIKEQEGYPIHAVFDIGMGDATSIWTVQNVEDKLYFLSYYENNNQALNYYVDYLLSSEFKYYQLIFPHDVKNRWWGSGDTIYGMAYKASSKNNWKLWVLPKTSISDGINAAKSKFKNCYFAESNCERGLVALGNYKYDWKTEQNVSSPVPIHDWSSHCADAFRYACLAQKNTGKKLYDRQNAIQSQKNGLYLDLDLEWQQIERKNMGSFPTRISSNEWIDKII
ncbi:MAG: phage terminase large subunit [Endomicrobium sp.]|nr:phage terminase large subunit [Endomicrobium sp.]